MRTTVTGVLGPAHVPEPIRSLHGLDRIDHIDLYPAIVREMDRRWQASTAGGLHATSPALAGSD